MKARVLKFMLATTAFAFTLAACSSDEETGGHSQPETVALVDVASGETFNTNFSLPAGSTTRIAIHFYDADGQDITEELIETGHQTALVFTPGTFASQDLVTGAPFERDVTVDAAAGATASLVVGYGHEDAKHEQFGSYEVTSSEGAAAARTAAR